MLCRKASIINFYQTAENEGSQYVVDGTNNTIYTSANSGQKTSSGTPSDNITTAAQAGKGETPQYSVSFLPHSMQAYGFDIPSPKSPSANYETTDITGQPTLVPWKSIEAGRMERLVAGIAGGLADSVRYYRESNNMVMTAPGTSAHVLNAKAPSGQEFKQIMLTGTSENTTDKLFAWYPSYSGDTTKTYSRILAGQLNMASYEKKTINVVLVAVNGSICPGAKYVEEELNKIYSSAIVNWKVSSLMNGLKVTLPHGNQKLLDNTDRNDKMDYTPEMELVNSAMKDNATFNSQNIYLFFFDEATDPGIKGYMPFNRQFGFIFKFKQYPDEYMRTIAHELGHGTFRLKHPYEAKDSRMLMDDNLMAYSQSFRLYKNQWDECHDKDWGVNWFEGEEEAEMSLPCLGIFDDCKDVIYFLDFIRKVRLSKKLVILKAQKEQAFKEYVATSLEVNKINYNKIRIQYYEPDHDVSFNPIEYYEIKDQQFFNKEGKIEYHSGFAFVENGKNNEIFRILIDDEGNNYTARAESLKNYLFGPIKSTTTDTESFTYGSDREYGWLSAEQESGEDGGCALGYDKDGGCSYGKHQIAARTGTLKEFIEWVNEKTSNRYNYFTDAWIQESKDASSKSKCQDCELSKKWMELCNDDDFNKWQYNFILETHYKPNYDKIISNFGNTELFKDMTSTEEEALKEMCVSLGVQHGGAYRIFQMALLKDYTGCSEKEILDEKDKDCSAEPSDFPAKKNKNETQKSDMKKTANDISMSDFIDRVYAARKIYVKANNVGGWENMVKNRYNTEPERLMNTLGFK